MTFVPFEGFFIPPVLSARLILPREIPSIYDIYIYIYIQKYEMQLFQLASVSNKDNPDRLFAVLVFGFLYERARLVISFYLPDGLS